MVSIKYSKMVIYLSFVIVIVFLTSCGSYLSSSIDDIKNEVGVKELPTAKDYPEDDGVILFENHNTFLEWKNTLVIKETTHSAKILFKNIEEYVDISFPLSWDETINKIAAQIYKPDGTKIVLKDDDFYATEAKTSGTFVTSDRTVKFTFPQVEKGSIIEYKIETESYDSFSPSRWYIQDYLPTLLNSYSLWISMRVLSLYHYYAEHDMNWNAVPYNYSYNAKPVISSNSDHSLTEWTIRNIPAFKPEPRMPHHNNYLTYIQFVPNYWSNWNAISKDYYYTYFQPVCSITEPIIDKAKQLTENCKTDKERIERIFDYVKKIRYVAIEFGVGGRMPHKPEFVMEKGYGDCKDKSTLLITLLRSLNIDAKPVLVLTKSHGDIDPQCPLMRFNHMIAKAITSDKKAYFLDATVEYAKAGELSYECSNIYTLVINDDGSSSLELTPQMNSKDNLEDITVIVNVLDENNVVYDFNFKNSGQANIFLRYFFKDRTEEEITKFCKKFLKNEYVNSNIENFHKSDIDSLDKPFEFGFSIKVNNGIQKQGDFYLVDLNPFDRLSDVDWLSTKERKYPIVYQYPYLDKLRIECAVKNPDFKIKSLPNNQFYSEPEMFFKSIAIENGLNEVYVEQENEIRTQMINKEKFENIKKYYEVLAKSASEKLILVK